MRPIVSSAASSIAGLELLAAAARSRSTHSRRVSWAIQGLRPLSSRRLPRCA